MMRVSTSGSYSNTERFLDMMRRGDIFRQLHAYGRRGVDLLAAATPEDTGRASESWYYQVSHSRKGVYAITWGNSDREDGVNVAVILQYGHGTGTGGYVQGRDYINPAIQPLFDQMVEDIWRQVKSG